MQGTTTAGADRGGGGDADQVRGGGWRKWRSVQVWERQPEVSDINGAVAADADRGVGGDAQVIVSFVSPALPYIQGDTLLGSAASLTMKCCSI